MVIMLLGNVADVSGRVLEIRDSLKLKCAAMIGHAMGLEN